jgi:Sulfotransferase family
MKLPNLVMAGPGKAGTTSLFWYLSQHPDICPASVKEIRYFAPITHGDGVLAPIETYAGYFDDCADERYRMEASPQYFHGGGPLIAAMREVLTDPRIIIILRDPVDRLWSTYRSLKVRRTLPASIDFDSYVAACERLREERAPLTLANRAYWTLSGGFYVEHTRPWLDSFGHDLHIVFFDDLAADPPGAVARICRWLGIDDECTASFNYTVENVTVSNRSRTLHRIALAANSEGILRDRRRLKAPLRAVYYAINGKPQAERMSAETRRRLTEAFESANAALATELAGRGYANLPPWLSQPADRRQGKPA